MFNESFAPPPGRRYHQLARTPAHRWWRPIVGTAAIVVVWAIAGALLMGIATLLYRLTTGDWPDFDGDRLGGTGESVVTALFLVAVIWIVFQTAAEVQKRPRGTVSSVAGRLRWRWLAVCCAVAAASCIVLVGVGLVTDVDVSAPPIPDTSWVIGPVLLIILVTAQEYVFRGWLLQAVGAYTPERRPLSEWPAILISAAIFAVLIDYAGVGKLDLFVFAVIAGWLAVLTGGIEAPIALSFVHLIGSAAVGLTAESGSAAWQYVVHIGTMLVFGAAVVWLARRLHIQTLSGATAAATSAELDPA